jgi:hypothetical protein
MSTANTVDRDERTEAVENASFRWAYLALSFGLLADVACRSLLYREAAWDLMALVVAGGAVATAYQAAHRVLARQWLWTVLLVLGGSALIAGLIALLGRAL